LKTEYIDECKLLTKSPMQRGIAGVV